MFWVIVKILSYKQLLRDLELGDPQLYNFILNNKWGGGTWHHVLFSLYFLVYLFYKLTSFLFYIQENYCRNVAVLVHIK